MWPQGRHLLRQPPVAVVMGSKCIPHHGHMGWQVLACSMVDEHAAMQVSAKHWHAWQGDVASCRSAGWRTG